MIYRIETEEYGMIEVDSELRKIYFLRGDLEYDLNSKNEFDDIYGGKWRVLLPVWKWTDCVVERVIWKEVGRTK